MKRWLPGVVVAAAGAALIALAFVPGLFTVAPHFNSMTDNFRPQMKIATLAKLHKDVKGLSDAQAEFTNKAAPALAGALKMTPDQFNAAMAQQFPATMKGMQAVPAITQQFDGVLQTLDNERVHFVKADAIPTKAIPPTVIPWALLGGGLVLLGCAMVTGRRWGAGLAIVLGAVLVAAPFALKLPGKADAADTMATHLKPVYTAQLVSGAKGSLTTMQAMGTEMQTKMLPGIAQMLNMPQDQAQQFMASNFPALTNALSTMPQSLGRFQSMVTAFDKSLGDFNDIKDTQLLPIVWVMIVCGGVALLGGVVALTVRPAAPEQPTVEEPGRHAVPV